VVRGNVSQKFYLRPKEVTLDGIYGKAWKIKFMEYRIQHWQVIFEPRTVGDKVIYIRNYVLLISQHIL